MVKIQKTYGISVQTSFSIARLSNVAIQLIDVKAFGGQ